MRRKIALFCNVKPGHVIESIDAWSIYQVPLNMHAGAACGCKVKVHLFMSDDISAENVASKLSGMDGILVAPGFGERGLEGKIQAVRYARENGIPFLGICLGMQMYVVEYARYVLGRADASSTELWR